MTTTEQISQSLENTPIKVHCKRAYKGVYVDVRSTDARRAQSMNRDIIVTCDSFPGDTMTIKCSEIETLKAFENVSLKYGPPDNPYTLKAYKFIPD